MAVLQSILIACLAVAAFILLIYGIYAIWLYIRFAYDIDCTVEACPESALPQPMNKKWFLAMSEPLLKGGFEDRGYWIENFTSHARREIVQVMVHPGLRVSALAIQDLQSPWARRIALSSVDEKNRTILTSNVFTVKVLPDHPDSIHWQLPWVNDLSKLVKAHDVFRDEAGFGPWKELTNSLQIPEALRAGFLRRGQQQVEMGYYRQRSSTKFTPTLRGAIVMAIRCMPPKRNWIWRDESLRAMAILRAAGVTEAA